MSDKKLKILLVAEESAGVQMLRRLTASEHEIVGVLTSEPGEEVRGATVWHVAHKQELDVLPARSVRKRSFGKEVSSRGTDLLLNVHSLYLIKPEVIGAPKIGSFNLHPGPLPRYAGLNAPSWALLHDEKQHGVTLHWMEPGIDTGHIAYQTMFDLTDKDTGLSVATRCIREGIKLLDRLLIDAAAGSVPRIEQDSSERSYFGKEIPFDGVVDWNWPARKVFNFVRAASYHPLPSPWGAPRAPLGELLDGRCVGLIKAEPTGEACDVPAGTVRAVDVPGGVLVACADEWLRVTLIHLDGKNVKPEAVLQGA